ncbi:GpE family phage tail protein [Gilliamella sp. Choc6-1]|uniref:GpE family phage tail protein n=1 Tax=unclassified Gilliamella TaxID=2685620 RepID=UPI003FA5A0AB
MEQCNNGIPNRVEDAIADIASIFHWQPSAMYEFTLSELMEWREQARLRSGSTDE